MRAPRGPKVGGGVMYRKGRADRQGGGSQVLVLVALGLVILTLGALWAGLNAPGSHRPQAAESTNRTVSEPEGELPLSEEEEELGPLDREPENSPEALIIKEGVMASAIKGSALPFLYGTAWKKERTTDLVVQAVLAGFRGIDTACQPKHYREDLVGVALRRLREEHGIPRESLWLQTKYTPVSGQDAATIPYDASLPPPRQAAQSIQKSLQNLGTAYIDSLVLHSPLRTGEETLEVWRAFEAAVDEGTVRQLGISNLYDAPHFEWIYANARHKPAVLQNRFYRDSGYDKELRRFCLDNGVTYQTFWTLTANPHILNSGEVQGVIKRLRGETGKEVTPAQVFFKFLQQSGHQPLTGTTSQLHMEQDLAAPGLPDLTGQEMQGISALLQ